MTSLWGRQPLMHRDENEQQEPAGVPEGAERGLDRRRFITLTGGLAGLAALGHATTPAAAAAETAPSIGSKRAEAAYKIRVDAAERERRLGIPEHPTNGDEERY